MQLSKRDWERLGWKTDHKEETIHFNHITFNSLQVMEGGAFIANDGIHHKGIDFLESVLDKKASAIFTDLKYKQRVTSILKNKSVSKSIFLFSDHFQKSCASTISFLYDDPSEKMKLVGVTGTNGKSSTALFIYQILNDLGQKAMYSGTLGTIMLNEKIPSKMTTPDIITLNQNLNRAISKNIYHSCIEVSSHGLSQGRTLGIHFDVGIFTNLSRDHLDYHGNMESYFESKKIMFKNMIQLEKQKSNKKPIGFIIFTDDPYGKRLYKFVRQESKTSNILSVGTKRNEDIQISDISKQWNGYHCTLHFEGKEYKIRSNLLGLFNLFNLAFSFAAAYLLGFFPEKIVHSISKVKPIEGRMEQVGSKEKPIIIDYAHTPDALKNALTSLRELKKKRLILVFGCGGERDQDKRGIMGAIASEYSDHCIISNDNPRNENPASIALDIQKGMKRQNYEIILDRQEAISKSIKEMSIGDILLIAGKGHENYQIIGDQKISFKDHDIVQKYVGS